MPLNWGFFYGVSKMGISSQGTELYFVHESAVMKVKCPTGFEGVNGGEAASIDSTCLDAKTHTSKTSGLKEAPAVSGTVLLDDGDESHKALVALLNSGEKVKWLLCLPGDSAAPTLTTGTLTPPTKRTSVAFEGYVSAFPWAFAVNDTIKGTLTIQTSGSQTVTWKAAT